MNALAQIETLLKANRGYVSKRPTEAVFLFSGGLDSTIIMAYCMEEWETTVHPLFVNRGQRNLVDERGAVEFFDDYFKANYLDTYNRVEQLDLEIPPHPIKDGLKGDRKKEKGYPMRDAVLQNYAIQYATSIGVTTVLLGYIPEKSWPDGRLVSHRAQTLSACINMGDEWEWQITSPMVDPKLETELKTKDDLLKYAVENDIPYRKTSTQLCGPDYSEP